MPDLALSQISPHVFWMSPGAPDRPSLCAVFGASHTLLLDAGASGAHISLFRDALRTAGVPAPRYAALTHWHWDHVFGASELSIPLIAHSATAEKLTVMAGWDWSDEALERRVAAGEETRFSADNIKLELPAPRAVRVTVPDLVFQQELTIRLGGVTCHIQHVGGDHAGDSCVMFIEPDRVLFLGDCLGENLHAPVPYFTRKRLFPLLETVLGFGADLIVEGHNRTVMTRPELRALADQMRFAGKLAAQFGADEAAALAAAQLHTDQSPDDDLRAFVRAFIAGREYE